MINLSMRMSSPNSSKSNIWNEKGKKIAVNLCLMHAHRFGLDAYRRINAGLGVEYIQS